MYRADTWVRPYNRIRWYTVGADPCVGPQLQKSSPCGLLLRLFDKLPIALGAADFDLAATAGHADTLAALGAAEIAMVLVLQMGEEIDKGTVFFPSCFVVSGKHTEHAQNKRQPAEEIKHRCPRETSEDHAQNQERQTCAKKRLAKLILTVATHHNIAKPIAELSKHTRPPNKTLVLL